MLVLGGPFSIVAVVLAVGGLFKLRDPQNTVEMLRALRLPASKTMARILGALEVIVGVVAFLAGGRWLAAAVALLFLVFAGLMIGLVAQGDEAVSCGCFGRLSARPSVLHVTANFVAAAVAVTAAVVDVRGFVDARPDLPAAGIPQLAYIVLGSWLGVVVLTVLPSALDAARRGQRRPEVRMFEVSSQP